MGRQIWKMKASLVRFLSSWTAPVKSWRMDISRAYIYGFRVRSNYRRLGIGGRMLQTVEYDLTLSVLFDT